MPTYRHHIFYLTLFAALSIPLLTIAGDKTDDTRRARHRMVDEQIKARRIDDKRVLGALREVERHLFVPAEYRPLAYTDQPLPIGYDQTISQPYIVALMTQLAEVDSTDIVLEIGTGSGYQAAVLSRLAHHVFTIEIVEPLADSARALMDRLGYENVTVRAGDGFQGWPDEAPFDAIVVTCAPAEIPQPLIDQFAEGGRLVIPVGEARQELLLLKRKGGKIETMPTIPVRFVPMTGEAETSGDSDR